MIVLVSKVLEWVAAASAVVGALFLMAIGMLWWGSRCLSIPSQVSLLKDQGKLKEAAVCATRGLWSCAYPCSERDIPNVQKVIDSNRLLLIALQEIVQPDYFFGELLQNATTLVNEQQHLLDQWQVTMSTHSHKMVKKQWYDTAIALGIVRHKMLASLDNVYRG